MILFILYDYFSPAYKAGGPIQSIVNLVESINSNVLTKVVCNNRDLGGEVLNVCPDKWITQENTDVYYCSKRFWNYKHLFGNKEKQVIFINGMYSLHYNLLPALLLAGRKIISVRGMLHKHALAQKPLKKKIYLIAWKVMRLHKTCEYHATSETEKEYILRKLGSKTKVWVVPNLPKILSYEALPDKRPNHLVISTVALISPMKNFHLVLEALLSCNAEISYHIFGPVKEMNYWKYCQEVIKKLPSNISVVYHGHVSPEEVPQVLAKTHVYVQPSQSENFGHSIFEALSAGRPVITSQRTPWNELEALEAGYNVSTDNSVEISSAISTFAAMNQEQLTAWSKKARMYALTSIDVNKIKKQYLEMFGVNSSK